MDEVKSFHEQFPPASCLLLARQCHNKHAECKLLWLVENNHFSSYFHQQNSPFSIHTVSSDPTLSEQCYDVANYYTPPPRNVDGAAAATAAAAANASAITTSPGGTPVAVISLKLISTTVPNVVSSNRKESGMTQKAANTGNQKGLGRFSQLNPLLVAQKAENANNQKGSGISAISTSLLSLSFGQPAQLVELRLWPACSTLVERRLQPACSACRAKASVSLLNLSSLDNACSTRQT
jgi:hypothetical protein